MHISKLTISNILGIESLEIEPGTLTEIRGANGTGKSSLLEAMKAVLGGGHDATLVRAGADKGEVVLLLDDKTEVRKTVKSGGSDTTVKDPRYGKISKPAAWLKERVDGLSNPVDLIAAKPSDRVKLFLEALPLDLPLEEMEREIGPKFSSVKAGVQLRGHALERLEFAESELYDRRTGVNREGKRLRSTVESLERDLPPEPERQKDWGAEVSSLSEEMAGVTRQLDGDVLRAKGELAERERLLLADDVRRRQAILDEYEGKAEDLRKQAAALQEEKAAKFRDLGEKLSAMKAEALGATAKAIEDTRGKATPVLAEIQTKLGQARAHSAAAERVKGQVLTIGKMAEEAQALEGEGAALTDALDRIRALREKLISALPIPGLAVKDGDIYAADGGGEVRPWGRLNTAQQIRIAIEVAKLRAKELKVILVDNFEHLDEKARQEFRRQVLEESKNGWHFFVTVVSGAATLEVETSGPRAKP